MDLSDGRAGIAAGPEAVFHHRVPTPSESRAVQIVGRLFGIMTTTPDAGTGALTGIAALALATAARASALASVLASVFACAAAAVFADVCFYSLSSFCSNIRSCCFSSAIS
jgi:hypothetical protein